MWQTVDRNGLVALSRAECLRLLRRAMVGRVGVTLNALPVILPVNFVVLDDDVIIRTGRGTKLAAATDGQVVCFEVDGYDTVLRQGWSVLVTGEAEVIEDEDVLARVRQLPLEPWAPSARDRYVRIPASLVSGRRVVRMDDGMDQGRYRDDAP